jgi:heterodisulfide reductase subunit A
LRTTRIGVYICNCGTNISGLVDTAAVARFASGYSGVKTAKTYTYMCSDPGQEMIAKDLQECGVDRVVIAACSPLIHERTFRKVLQQAGMNPYMLEIANIREQCSWVHENPVAATAKATALTKAAILRVTHHEPLNSIAVDMCPFTLVIGGGIAGMTGALELAESGNHVYLVEKSNRLGGNLRRVDLLAPDLGTTRDLLVERMTRIKDSGSIEVILNAQVRSLKGFIGNFTAEIAQDEMGSVDTKEVRIGNVLVCTGYKEFDAARIHYYGYGRLPNVITSFEFEKMLHTGRIETKEGKVPQYVAIVHCVGSRDEESHRYCSRVCCMTALKYTHQIKSAIPNSYISNLYIDRHAFGKGYEDLYREASPVKTLFLMYGKNEHPVIRLADPDDDCEMIVEASEKLSGETIEIPADLVILMVGLEPREDAGQVASLVRINQDREGWFVECHPKADPVATAIDGIYIAGSCVAPKDIPDTVAQARAAAARILGRIAKGQIDTDAMVAEVDEDRCSGCRLCDGLCPFGAIEFADERGHSRIISVACKACGCCVASCPSSAIRSRHYTDEQILAQIEGILK